MKRYLIVLFIGLSMITLLAFETGQINNQEITNEIISEEITVGKGSEWELSGMLTLPRDAKGKIPAVVLVHGSGPQDMDETVLDNKPFKDIAEYLAFQGIAVLRYNKRTYTHAAKIIENFRNFTVKEETVDDALLAANLLRNDNRIDSEKIFVLGHSLGGMVAPRIDAEGGNFAGIIILAGSPRRFADIWHDQALASIETLPENDKITGQAQINEIMSYFDLFKNMTDEEAKRYTLIGATGYYYKDLDSYPSNGYLINTNKPVLIMQGEKDFQVLADKDYAQYQTLLGGKANVTFKLYPGLNHLFMTSTTGTIDEYAISSHVDSVVLNDIVKWIITGN
jgi:dipeptidyl aminopeptidase/acylaminoacyl peptidase